MQTGEFHHKPELTSYQYFELEKAILKLPGTYRSTNLDPFSQDMGNMKTFIHELEPIFSAKLCVGGI